MNFLPFEDLTLSLNRKPSEIIDRLTQNTAAPRVFPFSKPAKAYEGVITGNQFKISRSLFIGSGYFPIITGAILPDGGGTRVHLTQRPTFLEIGILIGLLFFLLVMVLLNALLPHQFNGLVSQILSLALPVAMMGFGISDYWEKARHTKDELITILDASEYQSL